MATSAALALGLAATLWAGLPAAEVTSDCHLDVETGWASHVGPWSQTDPWRYPWPDVLWARQNGLAPSGSITDETEIHDITRVVALHRVMHETSVLGRYVLIEHSGTGRQEWALVLDALAGITPAPALLAGNQVSTTTASLPTSRHNNLRGSIVRLGRRAVGFLFAFSSSSVPAAWVDDCGDLND